MQSDKSIALLCHLQTHQRDLIVVMAEHRKNGGIPFVLVTGYNRE
ncbi:hypothetical protein [Methylobacterium sp. E-066]|nr:hypothetical protein [Methylobacterium sp. E-066]